MVDFLSRKGSVNVTENFDNVILYGFVSNLIFVLFSMFKNDLNFKDRQRLGCCYVFMEIVVAALWVIQLSMVLAYRFSHSGKVCSGDFAALEMIKEDAYLEKD